MPRKLSASLKARIQDQAASRVPAIRPRRLARRLGFDVVRYPNPSGSIGPHLMGVFALQRIDCVLDVGAHLGEYGALLRQSGYRGDIVSFEPVSASAATLEQRVAGDPRWTTHRLALGCEDGNAQIHVSRHSDLSSFRLTSAYGTRFFPDATVIDARETVAVRRLDGVLDMAVERSAARRFFLKMDTQGWDLEVMAGAEGCLDRIHGLQSEISVRALYEGSPSYLEALALLQDTGFELTGLFPVQRDESLRVVEFDCVMTKAAASRTGAGPRWSSAPTPSP